jgi:hypothetical protein
MLARNLGKSFVRQAEQILNGYRSRSDLCAQLSRPFKVISCREILTQMDGKDGEDNQFSVTPPVTTRALRGSGRRWSHRLFETLHEDWIREQCIKQYVAQKRQLKGLLIDNSNFGSIYRLGRHPSGSHVFTSCVADSFSDLDLDVPMIYLNFASINHLHQLAPSDSRRPRGFLHATHGNSPSIYILTAVPPNLDQFSHDYYLVPSTTLNTPQRAQIGQKVLENPRGSWSSNRISLSKGELIDVYATSENKVIDGLRRIFQQALKTEHLQMGDLNTEAGVKIDLNQYFKTRRDVLHEYVVLMQGNSFWGDNMNDSDSDDNGESVEEEE